MTTLQELRNYGRYLGIKGLWRKTKSQLKKHLVNNVHDEINNRMLRKPNTDPAQSYMEAELSLRSKQLTQQKTWRTLRTEARNNNIPVNRKTTKDQIERGLIQKRGNELSNRYKKTRVKKYMFTTLREWPGVVARIEMTNSGDRIQEFRITGNQNVVSTNLIMNKITPHI